MRHLSEIADSILGTIGQTPPVRTQLFLDRDHIEVFAKLESTNPGGNPTDRPTPRTPSVAMEDDKVHP